jgi:hypothetical protein
MAPCRVGISWMLSGGVPIEMVLDELDVADRNMARLMALCERENMQSYVIVEVQARDGPFNKGDSMFVRIIEAEAMRPRLPPLQLDQVDDPEPPCASSTA